MKYNPKVSIITVVFNSSEFLEKTIQSILNQTYSNIEYLIIDGGSTDGTLDIIKKYESKISYWISEPDKGIYDAMNKGIKAATGDYVWFINSGDLISTNSTLEKAIGCSENAGDVYYGETEIVDEQGVKLYMRRHKAPEVLSWKSFRTGMMVSHQSIIVKKELSPFYDLQYKVSADIDWCLKVLKASKTIINTHLILSKFMRQGFSKKNQKTSLKERFWIMTKNYGFITTVFYHFIIAIRLVYFSLFGSGRS
ncbi:MAG: glycosyltransferase [Bacteroidetes bacterium]|nr:glycosyltransferase [Bacteroidota bacterium]